VPVRWFDLTRLSPADRVLTVTSVLSFADSFAPWQRVCHIGSDFGRTGGRCSGWQDAWMGNGELAGGVMACLALALFVLEALALAGVPLPSPLPMGYLLAAFSVGTVAFGILKFALVVANHPSYGAWVGLALVAAVAGGGWWKASQVRAGQARGAC
jgi:hypothetical protein